MGGGGEREEIKQDREQKANRQWEEREEGEGRQSENKKFKECYKTESPVLNHRPCPSGGGL